MRFGLGTMALGVAALACGSTEPEDFALPAGAPAPIVTDATVYVLTTVSGGYEAFA